MVEMYDFDNPNEYNSYIVASTPVVYGQQWRSNMRGHGGNYNLSSIKLKVCREGLPNFCNLYVKEYDWNTDNPIGPILYTGSFNGNIVTTDINGELINIPLSGNSILYVDVYYCFYIDCISGALYSYIKSPIYSDFNPDYSSYVIDNWNAGSGTDWDTYDKTTYWEAWGAHIGKPNPTKIGGMFVKTH